jgi:hypothetical protein
MNKLNTQNFTQDIGTFFQVKFEEVYLIFRNENGNIYGLWFYVEAERADVYSTLNQLATPKTTLIPSPTVRETLLSPDSITNSKQSKEEIKKCLIELCEDDKFLEYIQQALAKYQRKNVIS